MPLFTWNEMYSVGHDSLDAQHRSLIEIINRFHEFEKGGSAVQVEQVLADLIGYTHLHFQDEERLMLANEYPSYAEHKTAHRRLTKTLTELGVAYASQGAATHQDISQFLTRWLTVHILGMDKQYAPYLGKRMP